MKNLALLIALWTALACPALAQDFEWLPGGAYDPAIPTPESVLGHEIGTRLTDHYPMLDYLRRVQAAAPDRCRLIPFGRSVEGREMVLLIVSSEQNMSRLEEIRSSIERLTDPRTISPEEASRIAAQTPPIGWMNYANDGGETAAFEAGIQIAYQLVAGTDPLTRKIRERIVTVINPAANPDSHQAFATWMKASTIGRHGTADPAASEHHVPWFISSDGNHYLIDSNRDAFALTQVETRAIAEMLHHWNPQVWIDNHGEPNEYTFAPFTAPVNLNYPPTHLKWATEIGRNTARYFDRFGWTYNKDEVYDLYYPGYWDSYPALNGAVGSTYETNGGGWKNLRWEKPDGTLSTLRGGIHAHFTANLATLETLADHGEQILLDFHDFFRLGMQEAESEQFKTYVLRGDADPARLQHLAQLLARHRVEMYRTAGPVSVTRAQSYFDRTSRDIEVPAGSYVIPLRQPYKRLIKTLLEPDPAMEEKFLQGVAERHERDSRLGTAVPKEGPEFYDVTAWALPLTFGVDAIFSEDALPVSEATRVTEARLAGGVERTAGYAYLFDFDDAGLRLAGRLLQESYRVAVANRSFTNSGREYAKGTLIVRVERNPESLHQRIAELAAECGSRVHAVDTAWGEVGITLGSRKITDLERPRILVLNDDPTRAVAFGAVYSLLEQRFNLEFTAARAEYFADLDLTRYNVIIFPDGSAAGYRRLLGDRGLEHLRAWIRNGGSLIGLKGGAAFATLPGVELGDVSSTTTVGTGEEESAQRPIETIPGSIFRVRVNSDYYLAYGYADEIAVQFRGSRVFSKTRAGANVATFAPDGAVQGYLWENTEQDLADRLYLADIPVGRGHVILFADDPTFRAYWQGLDRLVMAAVLLSTAY